MPRNDAEFLRRIRHAFRAEAGDHLQAVAQGLLAMERAPHDGDPALVEAVFRHTHSLKGAARAAGFAEIERVCQALEDVFDLCKRRRLVLEPAHYDVLHGSFDLVGAMVASEGDPAVNTAEIVRQAVDALSSLAGNATPPRPDTGRAPMPGSAESHLPVASIDHTRVAAPALDRLLHATEDMLAFRQRGQESVARLVELGPMFDAWGKQWSSVQTALQRLRRDAADADTWSPLQRLIRFVDWNYGQVRALEQRVHAAGESATRDAQALGRHVDDLLAQSKQLLLLPFSHIADVMPKAVRDLARSQGKDVELRVEGRDVQVDKRLLDRLKDPILHLLRNAVDHGIEAPAQRHQAGKAPAAQVVLAARLVNGGKIEILVEDDGRGIDPAVVRASAIARGVIGEDAAAQLDDAQSIDLVFHSDVSTSASPSEISGRGLGLAIVREAVGKLGGLASVEDRAAAGERAGTRFRLALPQAFGAFRGLFVRVGDRTFVVPALHVQAVARVARDALRSIRNRDTVDWGGEFVAIVPLAELLELPVDPDALRSRPFNIIVFLQAGNERLGVAVDEVVDEDDVLSKALTRPLVRVRNVAGATIDASGRILPVLNTGDLLKTARRPRVAARRAPSSAREARPARDVRILLAEDSITSRLLLKGILESAGYTVRTAVDGVDAFTTLRSDTFDVLVSDVEMPRLDGFGLTARIRADPVLSALPVVLVTALSRREERERGIDVGANAYIAKSGFDQRNLLDAVRRLVRTRERA